MQNQHLISRIKQLSTPLTKEKIDHTINLHSIDNIKCVALDFYGTMFISESGHINESINNITNAIFDDALTQCNFDIISNKASQTGLQLFKAYLKQRINQLEKEGIEHPEPDFRKVILDVLSTMRQEELIAGTVSFEKATQFVIEFEFRANSNWPMPNLINKLQQLCQQGIKLGIISNSQFYSPLSFKAMTGKTIQQAGFEQKLQTWSFQHGIKKPSADFYQLFIDQLPAFNLRPEQVLYVGNDLFNDIVPAKQMNLKTALFMGDKRSIRHKKSDLTDARQPDIIIDDLAQIEKCI